MNIPKIVTTISTELANTATKAVSNPIKTAPIIDGLSGLDALAWQNMSVIKKYFPYKVRDDIFQEAKTKIIKYFKGDKEPDNKTLEFIFSNFINENSEYTTSTQARQCIAPLNRFIELDEKTKEKFFSSNAIKILMDSIDTKAFRFSCFDLTGDEIDEIDKLIGDDFLKHYLKTYLAECSTEFQTTAKDILPEFTKRAKNLKYGFCCTKHFKRQKKQS